MATGSPVSFWYGTRAQFDSIETKLDTTLYFITDEQALYKGTVKFAGSGVDTLLTVSATTPPPSIVTTGDKYFDTTDNLIHVLLNDNGTVSTTATYEPANGALYYNATEQRFQTLVKDGSSYVPTEIYDAGISVAENGGLILDGTTLSGKDATTSAKGMVQVGDNLSVSDGIISAPTATNSRFGMVKTGNHITNNNGVISVDDASTSTHGVVQLVNDLSGISDTTKAITPALVSYLVTDLEGRKQDNMSATAPVALNGSNISLNVGDGLDVGVAGTTNANKLIVNEASVKEVLEDVVDGGTGHAVNEIVTADNLRGALSVGQAVDVSCAPLWNDWQYIKLAGDADWTAIGSDTPHPPVPAGWELGEFSIKKTVNGTTTTLMRMGFSDASVTFPKAATGLKYLFVLDVANEETISREGGFTSTLSSMIVLPHYPKNVVLPASNNGTLTWKRLAICTDDTGAVALYAKATTSTTLQLRIKNWRQYEVTNLTTEAIEYLAQLPDPDAFFRSTDVKSIRDRYLIKQDMVCPWIKTINMPDNSDLTVAAGLSYKITYTDNNTHNVTVDTIPTNAYGWDSHIQMFVKGASNVKFKEPLILMDALTSNAGHNLIVKYRNGQALVYVDDLNAGNIVLSTTGSTVGTLNYYLQQNPGTGQENYIIFGAVTDGAVCDASSVSVAYNTNVIGNGTDKTTITGTYTVVSGKIMTMQDLAISGCTFGAADKTGTITLADVGVYGTNAFSYGSVTIASNTNIVFDDAEYASIETDSSSATALTTGRNVTLTTGNLTAKIDSTTLVRKIISGGTIYGGIPVVDHTMTIENLTWYANGFKMSLAGADFTAKNCHFKFISKTNNGTCIDIYNNICVLDNVSFEIDPVLEGVVYSVYTPNNTSILYLNSCSFDSRAPLALYGGNIYISGTNIIKSYIYCNNGRTYIHVADDTVLDFSESRGGIAGLAISTTYGAIELGDNVTIKWIGSASDSVIDACTCHIIHNQGQLYANTAVAPYITVTTTKDVFRASNLTFMQPLDAKVVDTVKFSGVTFYAASKLINCSRLQLPNGSTNSFQGNTNDANTKIFDAGLIVVGDNSASPSGSATIVNASGTSSTVSGIGTYIDKEGDNDFVANNTTNVVAVDASTTGAKYLGTVLSATTGGTGANRFAKIDSGATAVVNEAVNAVNKQIITHDYEPIIGGTFSLTSATVNDATKTVAIQSGGTMNIVDIRGGKDSVIDLGGTNVIVSPGSTASASGCTFSGGNATSGGAINGRASLFGVVVTGNTAAFGGGIATTNNVELTSCVVSGNVATSRGRDIWSFQGTVDVTASTVGTIQLGGGASVRIQNLNRIDLIAPYTSASYGNVTISSGATLDLTGNSNATPIAPGGGIVFESGGATIYPSAGSASAVTIGGGTFTAITNGGILQAMYVSSGETVSGNATVSLGSNTTLYYKSNCLISGLTFQGGRRFFDGFATANVRVTNCTFLSVGGGGYAAVQFYGANNSGVPNFESCTFSNSFIFSDDNAKSVMKDCTYISPNIRVNTGSMTFTGSTTFLNTVVGTSGVAVFTSGAIVDLTGNTNATPINPGGGVIVSGGCTVINSAGVSVSIAGGTYTKINNDGTTE